MQTKYFTYKDGQWVFYYDENKYEEWEVTVDQYGIHINRYSEDHGGSFYFKELTEMLEEAVDIYRAYRNGLSVNTGKLIK